MENLQAQIEEFAQQSDEQLDAGKAEQTFQELITHLNSGTVRAASRRSDGRWQAHTWVKQGILLGFRLGELSDFSTGDFPFFDKHTYPLHPFDLNHDVRIVPGGSSVRTGSYLASGVVCMPPMYVNVGAYVDVDTMIDSHALVGSCAQIGRRVHLSAATQIGGVLEPIGARPVIVEDDVFIGGGCGLYEGCLVREGAVLASGVVLSGSTRLYDTVNERVIEPGDDPLEVPARAVVVPGARQVSSDFGKNQGLSLYTPVIVKYRDEKTDASTTLESALRS